MFDLFKKKENTQNVSLTLAEKRVLMISVLKEVIVPEVRKIGFTGTFPHFRKKEDEIIGLLSFQFSNWGGGFVVEIGKANKDTLSKSGKDIPFEKLNHTYAQYRTRIKPKGIKGDYWYSYEMFKNDKEFEKLAEFIIPLLPQVEDFLQNRKFTYKEDVK